MFSILLNTILPLFAAVDFAYFLQAIPLIIGISLVYAGTRCEDVPSLLKFGIRIAVWICGFMAVGYAILLFFFSSL